MRLDAFTRYGALGASSRVRLLQFAPALRAAGVDVQVQSLLDDDYLRRKYAGSVSWTGVARAYLKRLRATLTWTARDPIWVEKELWPWAPAWLERLVWRRRPVVLDYDDAIFHNYDLHRNALARHLFGHKIDALMRAAAMVVAGNEYLAQRARGAGARHVEILPTVVDLARYPPTDLPVCAAGGPVVIGWIGSPATVQYLRALAEPLARVASRCAIELRVIGARIDMPGVTVSHVPWSEADEVRAIAGCDIGIMPLPDSPWERGKCGYKLIQYMACSLPVVASPVGVNCSIVDPGQNGYLASDETQWEQSLVKLASDAELRRRFGATGRLAVEARYSLQVAAPRLAGWLQSLALPG